MGELGLPEDSLRGVRAEDDPLDPPQVVVVAGQTGGIGRPVEGHGPGGRGGDTLAGARMRVEVGREPRVADPQPLRVAQMVEEVRQGGRVVAGFRGDRLAPLVCCALVVPAVAREPRDADVRHQERTRSTCELLLGGCVALGSVNDLVTEDARQLVLGAGECDQSAGDIDVSAGQREGVGDHLVDDLERVQERSQRGVGHESASDFRHVGGEGRRIVDPHLGFDLSSCFLARRQVVVLG